MYSHLDNLFLTYLAFNLVWTTLAPLWLAPVSFPAMLLISPTDSQSFLPKTYFWTFWDFQAGYGPTFDSIPFFPLASWSTTFLLRHEQKSKFLGLCTRKWPTSLGFSFIYFFLPFLFLLLLSLYCQALQWLTFYWAWACFLLKNL